MTYLICSLVCILFRILYNGENYSILDAIKAILNFSACKYAWYIEMYLGLYIIIPFLNKVYNGCKDKKEKRILIGAFAFLTIVPSTVNICFKIIPSFWNVIYPITYYFAGAYLKEYNPKVNKKWSIPLLILLTVIFGTFNYFYFYKAKFNFLPFVGEAGIETFIVTTLIFIILMNFDLNKMPQNVAKIITKISELSLGMYLLSYIFDTIFYNYGDFKIKAPTMIEQFKYYFGLCQSFLFAQHVHHR